MRVRNTAKYTTRLGAKVLAPGAEVDLSDEEAIRFLRLLPHIKPIGDPKPTAAPKAVDAEDTAEIEKPKPKRKRRSKKKTSKRKSEG